MEKAISRQKILLHHLNPSSSTHVNESSSLYVCFISFLCFFQLLFSIMAFSSCCPFLPISLNSVFNLWENYPFANFARIISLHWLLDHNFVKVFVLNVYIFIQLVVSLVWHVREVPFWHLYENLLSWLIVSSEFYWSFDLVYIYDFDFICLIGCFGKSTHVALLLLIVSLTDC